MLKLNLNMIFPTTLVTYQITKIIDSKVILFIKLMDMAHKIFQNNMIILKTLQDQENKFMLKQNLNTIFPIILEIFQIMKTIDNKVTQSTKPTDMVPKISINNTTILKIQLDQASRYMLKRKIFHKIQETSQMFPIIDSKVIQFLKQMEMVPKTLLNNTTTP